MILALALTLTVFRGFGGSAACKRAVWEELAIPRTMKIVQGLIPETDVGVKRTIYLNFSTMGKIKIASRANHDRGFLLTLALTLAIPVPALS